MNLAPLISPSSIAIVGASERQWLTRSLINSLDRLGFSGAVYPINPKYESVLGRSCYPSLDSLPAAPDVVAFCTGNELLQTFAKLPGRGAKAAVIYQAGFAEHSDEGRRTQAEIASICREAGIALCGPNCMGILNPNDGSSTYIDEVHSAEGLAGNVGFISHSGSVSIAMLSDVRRFGFSKLISAGNEAVLNAADYLEHFIADDRTRVIGAFLESVRDPERFVAALDHAAAVGKPIVILKVGRSERSRNAIQSHTGGLAGESRVFSEVLKAHRAIEVDDLDELTEVLAALQGERLPRGRGIAVVTASGGLAELIIDVGQEIGAELPPLPNAERAEVEAVVGKLPGEGNPLDVWGNGNFAVNLPHSLGVLSRTDGIDAVVLCRDCADGQVVGTAVNRDEHVHQLIAASAASDKAHYLLATRPGQMRRDQYALLQAAGVPLIGGIRQGLKAIDKVARYAAWQRAEDSPTGTAPPISGLHELAQARGRPSINEFDAKRLLRHAGLPMPKEAVVSSAEKARAAAEEIGYPVVLKVLSDDIAHKSDLGLVAVGLSDQATLDDAYRTMADRVGSLPTAPAAWSMLVQQMVPGGLEVFVGVTRDPEFGPMLAFGAGGILIELVKDYALRPLPLRPGDAEAMIEETAVSALLRGVRGGPPLDRASLVECLERAAAWAHAAAPFIKELDLNPIKVLPEGQGCVVLDALIIPADAPASAP
jgi:acyl-CoA synthetase (NDP forming)